MGALSSRLISSEQETRRTTLFNGADCFQALLDWMWVCEYLLWACASLLKISPLNMLGANTHQTFWFLSTRVTKRLSKSSCDAHQQWALTENVPSSQLCTLTGWKWEHEGILTLKTHKHQQRPSCHNPIQNTCSSEAGLPALMRCSWRWTWCYRHCRKGDIFLEMLLVRQRQAWVITWLYCSQQQAPVFVKGVRISASMHTLLMLIQTVGAT